MRRRFLLSVFFGLALVCVADASASQLIDRNARGIRLAVNPRGEALLTYHTHGGVHHVRAWGAINARYPNPQLPEVVSYSYFSLSDAKVTSLTFTSRLVDEDHIRKIADQSARSFKYGN